MIIEVFGLPGTGKTSFTKALVQRGDNYKSIRVITVFELLYLNILALIIFPKYFFTYLFILIKHAWGKNTPVYLLYIKFMNLFLHSNAKFIKAKFYDKAIIDQGYCMSLLSLFEKEVSYCDLSKLYQSIKKPDFLIILESSDLTRQNRLHQRGYGVRNNFSKKYRDSFLNIMAINYLKAKIIINNDKSIKKIIINTDSMAVGDVVDIFLNNKIG